jgi:cytochrome o ubiquinol oxidase subunit 2
MPEINKKSRRKGWPLWVILLPLIDLVLVIRYLVYGKNIALFNPKGFIAHEQHSLMIFTLIVLLSIFIPTLVMFYFIAWKYRESNAKASYNPGSNDGILLGLCVWAVPIATLVVLASVMVPATHRLVPQKAIASGAKPLTIQVISLRWKWLFIYPDQKVASVNFVQLPVNTPVTFEMTADETPMSSFWIPNLGGQLYTMTSHVNRLNLMADKSGDYSGSSAEINGAGFAGMKFTARAGSVDAFDSWVQSVKQSPDELDEATYKKLLVPSEDNPSIFYSAFEPTLFANVISKYEGPGGHHH